MRTVEFDFGDSRVNRLFGLDEDGDGSSAGDASGPLAGGGLSLVLFRESGKEPELMEGQMQQVLSHFPDLDGADALRKLGVRAYETPEQLPAGFDWARIRYRRARAVMIRCGQTLYMIAMESAAKSNVDKRNEFSELLYRVVSSARPTTIYLASLSRLIRSLEHSSRIEDPVKRYCKRLRTVDMEIELGTPFGTMQWSMLSIIAAGDRDYIAQRFFSGKVQSWRMGRWPLGAGRAIPLGYRLDDGTLVVDPSQRDLLVSVFEILADESKSVAEAAFAIRGLDIAVARRKASGDTSDEASWGDVSSPRMLLRRLLHWADLYTSGVYYVRLTSPYKGLDSVLGLPVEEVETEDGPRQVVQLPYELGKPDIEPALVKRALEVRGVGERTPRQMGLALNSWRWRDDERVYWLRGTSRGRYDLVQRLNDDEDSGPMFTPDGVENGTLVAGVDASELHASLLAAFADGLDAGVALDELSLVDSVASLTGRTPADAARLQIAARREQVATLAANRRRAIANSSRYDDQRIADDLLASAAALQDEMDRLETEIAELEILADAPLGDPEDFESNDDVVMAGLSVLGPGVGQVTRQGRSDLARVIDDFSMRIEGDQVAWSCYLLLPAPDRILRVGPFEGSVARAGRILPAAVQDDPTNTGRVAAARRELEMRLKAAGWDTNPAKCASRAPQMLLARVLLGEDVVWPDCDDSFDHAAFNDYLREVWRDPDWNGRQYVRTKPERQILADLVAAFGGRVSFAKLQGVAEEFGLTYQNVHYLTRSFERAGGTRPWMSAVVREGEWSPGSSKEDHFLLSRRCLKCGQPATAVVRVLEVPGDLLCRVCRVPTIGDPIEFPPLYVDLALPPTVIDPKLLA